ncbi:MAG: 2-hydroxyacyl-CoA dehydratase [Desulfobacterales bacterium]|nr:2-hydroxyacyl-CoA dehydratase [Desulfobacterales bacterium]
MDSLKRFKEIASKPSAYAQQWKTNRGGEVIGTFCSYAPEEIILASGCLGYRIFGTDLAISRADAHMQAYSCSLVRGALEEVLAGGLDFLDGTVFPHTCDSIQRLSDIWRMNVTDSFHLDLVMPVKLNTDSARDYMTAVLQKFKQELEAKLEKEISDTDMAAAIQTGNRIRAVMQKIYATRMEFPMILKGSDIHAMVKAGMVMDRNEFLKLAENLAAQLKQEGAGAAFAGKRIVLSGGLCNMPDIYAAIESAGGAIVADDLCTGSRFFEGIIESKPDPLEAIADRYIGRNVCPAKHAGMRNRGENLVRTVKESGADGVIFLYLKFCDPHGFDYPYLKEMLAEQKIPCLLYEMEEQDSAGGQFQTRCEAFMEML